MSIFICFEVMFSVLCLYCIIGINQNIIHRITSFLVSFETFLK